MSAFAISRRSSSLLMRASWISIFSLAAFWPAVEVSPSLDYSLDSIEELIKRLEFLNRARLWETWDTLWEHWKELGR